MPSPGAEKWTLRRAQAYREERLRIGGVQGLKEENQIVDRSGVLPTGSARERYDKRVGKVRQKLAGASSPEDKEQLALAGVMKDLSKHAANVNSMLMDLGNYLAFMSGVATFIPGPVKTLESAWRKTSNPTEYNCDYSANKDLIRCTLACDTQQGLPMIVREVHRTCSPMYGMQLIKNTETKPVRPPTKGNPCNYSGWNFAVVFKGVKLPAEIQVNTFAMMYGKMTPEDYASNILGGDKSQYCRLQERMGFPGGLGHICFEIARYSACGDHTQEGTDAKRASDMGCWYHDLCRMSVAQRDAEARKCVEKYRKFCSGLQTSKAKQLRDDHPLDPKWGGERPRVVNRSWLLRGNQSA